MEFVPEDEMLLTDREIRQLTGRKRFAAQCRALGRMGLPHDRDPDGRPLVLREVVMERLGGEKPPQEWEPDFSVIRG
ncbi:hypothetical protein HH1059_14410 [Halorhodospira halochloris]|uniref:DUF4224 domain-containing protein n=2 Tax=Halorhodospira halochloris TaxID=1052 RepID=A0A0X8X9U2_HALHR|nr:hypothetical protein [Halorhodospira halochloris]BAU58146.1 hypothetical protein HH1059_14410 [Halorhodospira halochloris]